MFKPGNEGFLKEGSIMFLANSSKLERSLFNQTALFCAVGLFVSLALVLAYDLPLA